MKKKINGLLLFFTLFFSSLSFSQNLQGVTYSILNVGSMDYAYIYVESENVFYKTAAYNQGLLFIDKEVEIIVDPIQNTQYNAYVTAEDIQIGVYATALQTDLFTLPLTSVYGMPILENEILFFSGEEHFDEFYNILTDFASSPYEEMWDLLMVFEEQFSGFTSFNKMIEDEFPSNSGEITPLQFEQLMEKDYFGDMIIKSIVNQYSEVGIGNEIHTLIDNAGVINEGGISIVIPRSRADMLIEKRDIRLEDFIGMDGLNSNYDYYIGSKKVDFIKTKGLHIIGQNNQGGDLYVIYSHGLGTNNVNCSVYSKTASITINRTCDSLELLEQGNFEAEGTIYWGDGDSSVIVFGSILNSVVGDNGSASESRTHTYQDTGSYTISYKISYRPEIDPIEPMVQENGSNSKTVLVNSACSELEVHPQADLVHIPNEYTSFMVADSWIIIGQYINALEHLQKHGKSRTTEILLSRKVIFGVKFG